MGTRHSIVDEEKKLLKDAHKIGSIKTDTLFSAMKDDDLIPTMSNLTARDILRRKYKALENIFEDKKYLLEITQDKIEKIENTLKTLPFFQSFGKIIIKDLAKNFKYLEFPSDLFLATDNEKFEKFFLIEFGEIQIEHGNKLTQICAKGDFYGEVHLVNAIKPINISTITSCKLFLLSKEEYSRIIREYYVERYKDNYLFLNECDCMTGLNPVEIDIFLSICKSKIFKHHKVILPRGTKPKSKLLYIIKEGQAHCYSNSSIIKEYNKGDLLSLKLVPDKENYSDLYIVATTRIRAIGFDTIRLKSFFHTNIKNFFYQNIVNLCIKLNIFGDLYENELSSIYQHFKIKEYPQSSYILKKHKKHEKKFYVVLQGRLKSELNELKSMDCINMLYQNNNKYYDTLNEVYAIQDSTVAVISKAALIENLKLDIEDFPAFNSLLNSLKQLLLFKFLDHDIIMNILANFTSESFKPCDIIASHSKPFQSLLIIKDGIAEIEEESFTEKLLKKGCVIGEKFFLVGETYRSSIIAKTDVECWSLSREKLVKCIPDKILAWLYQKNFYTEMKISISELKIIKRIDTEPWKLVFIIESSKGIKFIAKTINRNKLNFGDHKKNIVTERQCNLIISSPMIVDCVSCLSDKYRIYLLYEFIEGRSLRKLLESSYKLKEDEIKYYFACMILIIERLHKESIIYRNLSSKKFLITTDGYLKLKDFSDVKITKRRTYSIVGDVEYMSPEMILGKGYFLSTDLWGLGVILYEMFFQKLPFVTLDNDPFFIISLILRGEFRLNDSSISEKAEKLIRKLLSINPLDRGTIESIKNDEWLDDVDWKNISRLNYIKNINISLEPEQYNRSDQLLVSVIESLENA